MIDPLTQQIVEPELDRDEKTLWAGRAGAGSISARAVPGSIMGVILLLFALFWMGGAASAGAPTPFVMFGLIFVGVAVYLIASPAVAYQKGASTIYAVTTERALIIEGSGARSVQSFRPQELERIERRERGDGNGDVVFARELRRGAKGRTYTEEIGFWGIDNAREVERLLRQLADKTH